VEHTNGLAVERLSIHPRLQHMNQTPLRPFFVVLATDSPDPSGVGHHMITLAQSFSSRFAVRLAFADNAAGLRFVHLARAAGLVADAVGAWRTWLAGAGAISLNIHAGIGWEGHDIAAAGQALGLPVLCTEHLPWLITDPSQRSRYMAGLAGTSHLICVSSASLSSWHDALAYVPRRLSIHHIPNGILPEPPRGDHATTRVGLGIASDAPLILHVGRFAPQKDHATLIAAFARLQTLHPDAQLCLVGTGDGMAAAQEHVAAKSIGGVHFLGLRDDVPDLMHAADLLALPSLFEGLPLVVLEAMAARLPVVATRIGGVTEALGHDHPWLVPVGDAPALAQAMHQALTDGALCRRSTDRQSARFTSRFTASRMAPATEQVYDTVLVHARPAGAFAPQTPPKPALALSGRVESRRDIWGFWPAVLMSWLRQSPTPTCIVLRPWPIPAEPGPLPTTTPCLKLSRLMHCSSASRPLPMARQNALPSRIVCRSLWKSRSSATLLWPKRFQMRSRQRG
jgi:glycosyltransferase involved in cell wall biosynthesis